MLYLINIYTIYIIKIFLEMRSTITNISILEHHNGIIKKFGDTGGMSWNNQSQGSVQRSIEVKNYCRGEIPDKFR